MTTTTDISHKRNFESKLFENKSSILMWHCLEPTMTGRVYECVETKDERYLKRTVEFPGSDSELDGFFPG